MSNYYQTAKGFSYFQVPNRLMELRPKLGAFVFDTWLVIHYEMQTKRSPFVLLADEKIAANPSWGGRSINTKEISKARSALKKYGLLHYRREGKAWTYFATNPVNGYTIDPTEAAQQVTESKEQSELSKALAEIAALKIQMAAQSQVSKPVTPHSGVPLRKSEYAYNQFEDTGAVEEDAILQ